MNKVIILAGLCLLAALACSNPLENPPAGPQPGDCPEATSEPFWVEPIPASTDQDSILVEVYIGNGEVVTVTTESGTFIAEGGFNTLGGDPAQVEVMLLPGETHHLEVSAEVKELGGGTCPYGGYTLRTTSDKNGDPLVIVQVAAPVAGGPTPSICVAATQMPLYVDPLPPTTDQTTIVVAVSHLSDSEVTIVTESGTFTGVIPDNGPALIEVTLLPGVTHHLVVTADVPVRTEQICSVGGYTITTEVDTDGNPLVIAQGTQAAGGPTPTLCPQPTPEPLWVEPIPATTDEFSVVVTVYIGNGEAVDVVTESGKFGAYGQFTPVIPALVQVTLLPGVTHHLEVTARVAQMTGFGGCQYGGYVLTTTTDRDGGPLEIVQTSAPR